ncbi:MAG: chemotaxis-specific protein-glutamate methyltransferase CheB [Pseudomonas sp.]|uniref:chemotaxis-specific protein-glutamate methyltransferase CheB n=1 Tax=Pseudomonas sp. TaxID=306 RepID=UPI00121F5E21|nr:chemotaxis-specific protein-glutamate methyltransferase CheB [Pseudomonas sp.]RZI76419.1 MAG: chemotaxis-specific protein-glutamate methyltransferase CheB [Pseudomonas sp.]
MRIAIVNDMPLAVEAMRRVLLQSPQHHVAWTALDGEEALERCRLDRPDLILMDLIMPRMDGVEATRRIMTESPCAILIVTADVETNAARAFAALGHGALDAVDTPVLGFGDPRTGAPPLLAKIEALARLLDQDRDLVAPARVHATGDVPLVAIGASAGGPAALAALLKGLSPHFSAGLVIVQHVDARFTPGLATWLGENCALPVRLAKENDRVLPGQVLIAGTDEHLIFKSRDRLGYTSSPAHLAYRPSIDVFFESAARIWPSPLVGVLLTGMGSDGARGLKVLRDCGHPTIAQDQATSAVYGMPKAAAALGAAAEILGLPQISGRLTELVGTPCPKRGAAA